jgi:hypothetical protein
MAVVFDAGALMAFERADRAVVALVARTLQHRRRIWVPAPVVAQTWRDGRTQARLAMLLGSGLVEVVPLDDLLARKAGQLCGVRGTADLADAAVAMVALERGLPVATSHAGDLRRLAPRLELIEV